MLYLDSVLYLIALSIAGFTLLIVATSYRVLNTTPLGEAAERIPRSLVLFIGLLTLHLVFEIVIHTPGSSAKYLWLYLSITVSLAQPFALGVFARELKLPTPHLTGFTGRLNTQLAWVTSVRWVGALTAIGMIAATPRLFLINSSSQWRVGEVSEVFWSLHHTLTVVLVCMYVATTAAVLGASVLRIHMQHAQTSNRFWPLGDSLGIATFKLATLYIAAVASLNIIRALHCYLYSAVNLGSHILSALNMLLTLTFLALLLVTLLKATKQTRRKDGPKYIRSALDGTHRQRIKVKLIDAMKEPELVTRNNLSLAKLCSHIEEKQAYVSQVLNQELGCTFFDLLNTARIALAQQQLRQQPKLPIVDVCEAVGFNSKTTFYSAFKKVTGQTVTEFRQSVAITGDP